MSAVVSEMLIRIAADTAQLRSEMDEAKRTVGGGFEDMKAAGASLKTALTGLLAGLALGSLAKSFIEAGDAMSQLDARLKNAVGSGKDFKDAQDAIYTIAQKNNIGLQEAATLYTKLHEPVQRMGGTTKETGAIVEAFALSLRLGGAGAQEASAATLQFAQAMGSGKLQGDEFRSMAETSPRFLKALADSMGVPVEKLKEMGSEGKLTTDVIGNAMVKALEKLRGEAQSMPDTVGGAFTRIKNDVLLAINELNTNSGLTLGIAGLLETVRLDVLPVVRDELAGAFEAVGAWISNNKDGLIDVWDQVKLATAEAWALGKEFFSVLGWIMEILLQSGFLKTAFESVRLIVAGVKDGMDLVVATFALMGAQILKVLGFFSDGAKTAAREAEAAGLAVYKRFMDGDTEVQKVIKSIGDFSTETQKATTATNAGVPAMRDAETGYRALKSSVTEQTDEQKKATKEAEKAKAEYDKLVTSITNKTGQLIIEGQETDKLTEGQKAALKVMQDIQTGTLKLTDDQKAHIRELLEQQLQQEKTNNEMKAAEKAAKAQAEAIQKAKDEEWKQVDALKKSNDELEKQNDKLRFTEAELVDRETQLLKTQANELLWKAELQGGNDALDAQAKALLRRAELLDEGTVLKEAKATKEEWDKTAESIQQGLTDSLFRAAEDGKGFFQTLKDSLKGMFNNLVLKPIINAVMKPIAGTITSTLGGLGIPGMAGASTGGGQSGGALGGLGDFGSMISGLGSMGSFASTGFMNTIAGGAGLFGNTMVGLEAAGSMMANGSIMSGLGMGLGTVAPYLLAAVAIMSLLGEGGGPKTGGQSIMQILDGVGSVSALQTARAGDGGRYIYTPETDDARVASLTETALKGITDMARLVGGSAGNLTLGIGYDADPEGKAGTRISSFLTGGIAGDVSGMLSWNRSVADDALPQELANEVQRVIVAGLKASDLPDVVDEIFANIDPATASIEQLNAALAEASALGAGVQAFNDAVRLMPFENLKGLSFEAAAGLVKLAGGIENLLGQIQTYYQNFYSETEQAGITAQQAISILEDAGISGMLVENRAEFRALFESLNANTEEGRKQIAAMLQVAGAMASVFAFLEGQPAKDGIGSIQELIEASPQVTVLESMLTPAETTAAATETIAANTERSVTVLETISDAIADQTTRMTESDTALLSGLNRLTDATGLLIDAAGALTAVGETVEASATVIQQSVTASNAVVAASTTLASAATSLADSVSLSNAAPTYATDIGAN